MPVYLQSRYTIAERNLEHSFCPLFFMGCDKRESRLDLTAHRCLGPLRTSIIGGNQSPRCHHSAVRTPVPALFATVFSSNSSTSLHSGVFCPLAQWNCNWFTATATPVVSQSEVSPESIRTRLCALLDAQCCRQA